MIIRKANISDAKRLSYLIRKNIERVEENEYTPIQRQTWSDQNKPRLVRERLMKRETFCAFLNKQLAGTIALDGNLICGMSVSYTKRGTGIGQQLLNYIENYAGKKALKELILTASPNGYGFYLKNGYQVYGKMEHHYNGVRFPELKMKKKL